MRKIATWNVNSIKVRLPHLLDWLKHAEPDVVCLQELKCQDEGFPAMEIAAAGYKALVFGQKSYNGVAILSRGALTERRRGLPGDASDEQARYLEADVGGLVVASIYLPNGNPVVSEKFPYKLKWMTRLRSHARHLLAEEKLVVLAGDYNAIPEAIDCHDPVAWRKDALFRPETQAAFRALKNDGWTDAFRTLHPDKRAYSFWDYQAGAWQNDHGIRIDHLLLSPQAADRLEACEIEKQQRAREKASDHVPVWCSLKD